VRYGGNTPCVEIRNSGNQLTILDAGTGIRGLGQALVDAGHDGEIKADIFVTHAHWDHIHGIPFFAPLYTAGNCFRMWATDTLATKLERVISDQMSPAVFPVCFDELPASIEFCDVAPGGVYGSGCVITSMPVQHPGGALGYRVSEAGSGHPALVYVSDNELGTENGYYGLGNGWRTELTRWTRGAKVLVHDATYIAAEYEAHRGWGHSTCDQAVELALESEVEQLVLYHHKPERTDEEIDGIVAHCGALVKRLGGTLSVTAAAEGMELTV
jgi:phosphoribosyl 1,2-cyclic phosphodiesterase